MPHTFEFRGLRCFASQKEATTWCYLPLQAGVQHDVDGRPLIAVIDVAGAAYLLFTATWPASQEDLGALRREIAARESLPRDEALFLVFAPITSPRCDVLMGDGRSYETVASSSTAGFAPYDATFNLHLQGERLAHAKAALHGESGRMAVEYSARLQTAVAARVDFYANRVDLAAAIQGVQDRAALRQALDRAIADGRARVVIDSPNPDASHLASELYDRVLDRASDQLPRLMRAGMPDQWHVSAAMEQEIGLPICAFFDLAMLRAAKTVESDLGGHHAAN